MAFGIKRHELVEWKQRVKQGEIAFLTHFWLDARFPHSKTVTKVGCCDIDKLVNWGKQYGLQKEWIHDRDEFPHFDLLGERQKEILRREKQYNQIERFHL